MNKFPIILLFVVSCVFAVSAQIDGNPENMCRNGFFPRDAENYSLATVIAKKRERVYFYSDEDDCPNGKTCRTKSYLIGKDEVIVSSKFGKWVCAWYQPARGSETVGWIEESRLKFADPSVSLIDEWLGEWSFYENSIKIAKGKSENEYKITGEAFWKGLGDNVHIGELDGIAKFSDSKFEYGFDQTGEYDCRATLRPLGNYLIVSDNLNCGGANVTFSGVYRRKK